MGVVRRSVGRRVGAGTGRGRPLGHRGLDAARFTARSVVYPLCLMDPAQNEIDDAEAIRSAVNPIAHGLQTSAILRWLSMPENYHTALTRGLLEQQQEQQQAVPALEEKKES